MQISPEQQQAIDQQKAQCIFCQIASGKMPSKKVYEDDLLIGILDINPATKGHVLLMPKEHYPIMPIIPPDTFKHLFDKTKEVDGCVKEALLCKETTILIANGGAAGQQSTHFMLHIIPRESGDGLDMLDVAGKEAPEAEMKEVAEKVGQILQAMLAKNLPALGYGAGAGTGGAVAGGQAMPQKVTKEQLLQIIESNPQVKDIIINKPEQFKQMVPQHPQLSQLFQGVDIDEIIEDG
jgi:histidine triad (HIT) family protein